MNWVGSEDPILVMMGGALGEFLSRLGVTFPRVPMGVTKRSW